MKAIKYILFLLLILIIGLSIYVAVQPNDYKFSRNRIIEAPVSIIYNKVNDFKQWPEFSPWLEQDKEATLTYSDNSVGKGSSYSWNGAVLGEGSMTTLNTDVNSLINQKIEFIKPFEANADIDWTFEPSGKDTKVTWQMKGKLDFVTKIFTMFSGSIESNTGPDFERGLFKLDSVVQAEMKVYSIKTEGITQHSGGYYLYTTKSCKFSDFEKNMTAMLPKVGAYAMTHNVTMAGPPFILYHKWDEENDTVMFSTCVPTNSKVTTDEEEILTGKLDSFKAVKTVLTGNYSNLKEAWETTMKYIADNNLEMVETGSMLETYLTDPMSELNPAKWVTEIYVEVKEE
ncbi:SRPBCC family protein [Winogradskyella litoriviva]|uniref:SRPBCC family protein n=1 Tax=Winogradskyella litoriviva TaxID=1220182 RepID=A0ABX2E4F8_9FLAO|nr:SRPBCC family protein [Winogradskyella litoriviva]NRD22958.1 SRPBCC family protein [Winogradskyella litoriviva]